jgi:hypothetical protein
VYEEKRSKILSIIITKFDSEVYVNEKVDRNKYVRK